jgi:hypothetical protein
MTIVIAGDQDSRPSTVSLWLLYGFSMASLWRRLIEFLDFEECRLAVGTQISHKILQSYYTEYYTGYYARRSVSRDQQSRVGVGWFSSGTSRFRRQKVISDDRRLSEMQAETAVHRQRSRPGSSRMSRCDL